jgi:hypothetical protein
VTADINNRQHVADQNQITTLSLLGLLARPQSVSVPNKLAGWQTSLNLNILRLDLTPVHILDIGNLEEVARVGAADTQNGTLALAVLPLALDAAVPDFAVLLGILAVRNELVNPFFERRLLFCWRSLYMQ